MTNFRMRIYELLQPPQPEYPVTDDAGQVIGRAYDFAVGGDSLDFSMQLYGVTAEIVILDFLLIKQDIVTNDLSMQTKIVSGTEAKYGQLRLEEWQDADPCIVVAGRHD